MVKMYGGVVLDELSGIVTHHVVGDYGASVEGLIGYRWLKECVRERRVLPVDE